MLLRIRSIVAAVLCLASLQATAWADIIFDNTTTGNQGITTTSAAQLGDEVTAVPGTSRTVTELDIGFTSQGVSATADLQAFIYANDGTGGAPGTLLWMSAVMTGVHLDSVNTLVAFSVPSVVVPDTFTFTSAITNASPTVGYVPASGATTGTFVQPWVGSPGSFSTLTDDFETEGRVIAASSVPEPATLVLLSMGLVGALSFSRIRRVAADKPR
jgi:PEP-CTERM motif